MSKTVFAVLVVCAVALSAVHALRADADVEVEVDVPTTPPRRGKPLKPARTLGPKYGNTQKVVIVPKGDPRAQAPPSPPKPVQPQEPKVIVEADAVEPVVPQPPTTVEVVDAASPTPFVPSIVTGGNGGGVVVPPTAPSGAGAGPFVPPIAPAGGAGAPSVPRPLLKNGAPNPGACLARYNGATAAARASTYQATYKSRGVRYSQPNRQFGINAKYADCSSFVTSILTDIGMNCLFDAGRYTAYMNKMIAARGGYSRTANVGDIVMWGSHTGMIVRVCSPGVYSMVAMGNSGAGRAECKTPSQLAAWGSGGWLGFWRPRP